MQNVRHTNLHAFGRRLLAACVLGAGLAAASAQTVDLADRPMFSTNNVPGNLMLALSVEWPTANTPAYLSTTAYNNNSRYLGYFVPTKCYRYQADTVTPSNSYFVAHSAVSGTGTCATTTTTHLWSGNYLNWAAMQSLDIFRWTLTGGDRVVDTATETIVEKTRESGQAGTSVFPDKTLSTGVSTITPFSSSSLVSRGRGMGTYVLFSPAPVPAQVSCTFGVNSNRRVSVSCTGSNNVSYNTNNNEPAAGASHTRGLNFNNGQVFTCVTTRSASGVNSGNNYSFSCTDNDTTLPVAMSTCSASAAYASSTASASCSTAALQTVDYKGTGTLERGFQYRAQIRAKACDATGGGVESNCKAYGTNYKPEGLMQEYAMQLRFGAFGYLNDDFLRRDGGVLRAPMKSIGPQVPVPGSTPTTNASTEWDSATGQIATNPDASYATQTTADAATTGFTVTVSNSGVMNYLNRFGKVVTGNYKGYDPVSEMYYAATRYFRKQGNVPEYTSFTGVADQATLARWIDGFPVIRNWNDPMQYSCQKNFILGIGDVYSWADKNLPGSTESFRTTQAGWATGQDSEPSMPSTVSGDTAINVTTATNMVGQLEGLTNLATQFGRDANGPNRANSNFLAGLAYDAHTRDIRADLPGQQTISTYWLDVRESQTYESRNQYWLAAKYGGFDVPANFDPYATANGTTTLTSGLWTRPGQLIGSDQRPNNYFVASDPQALADGLRGAFARIASENGVSTNNTFSTVSPEVRGSSTVSYKASYTPANWTGNVEASELVFNQYGVPTKTVRWLAGSLLDAKAPSSRQIITCCTSTGAALPFQSTNLAAATLNARAATGYTSFANVPGVAAASQSAANFVNYLRGVRTLETTQAGGVYRSRASVLGDVVGSKITPVAAPQSSFLDQYNPGYAAFRTTYASRKTVIYVGANDGMMHAFDGAATTAQSPTPGSELFAYIPSFVHSTNGTAPTNGLATLGDPNYLHSYFVNATPKAFDVDFFRTPSPVAAAADWRTMLVGGLGKGGRGYYALDVTDPSTWTSETAVANRFLWEFTDSRMGLTFGDPIIAKTAKYGWTVIVPSGYNNSDGVGYLFLLNPRTGALLEAIATPEGSSSAAINMAHLTAYSANLADYTVDAVYAGDMLGNVWRFDLTAATGALPAPIKIAKLTDSGGVGQPITTRVRVATDTQAPNKRFVVVGTGRLMADSDILDAQTQSLYVIADGAATSGGFYRTATLPSGVSFPITRSVLNNNTSVNGIGANPALVMGWYLDLPVQGSIGSRIDKDLDVQLGAVLAAANLPDGQACSGGGTSRLYVRRLSNGQSAIVEPDANGQDALVAYRTVNSLVNTVALINLNGRIIALTGTNAQGTTNSGQQNLGGQQPIDANTQCQYIDGEYVCTKTPLGDALSGRLNWREVQTSN
jgi:type IV pilus assembly protein PilY1